MTNQNQELALERIRQGALRQQINFENSANAFTLWSEVGSEMQHCGSCTSLDDAQSLANDHTGLTNDLYIVRASSGRLDIMLHDRHMRTGSRQW